MSSIPTLPLLVLGTAAILLVWGYLRSRRLGQLGLLAWFQLVALVAPWLIYFSLFVAGVFVNFALLLAILVLSSLAYIVLGNRLRQVAASEVRERPAASPAEPIDAVPPSESQPEGSSTRLLPTLVTSPDLKIVQGIFGIDTFYANETQPYLDGAIFRGNLRADPDTAHQQLSAALRDRLGTKYNLFLVEGQDRRPVVVVLPNRPERTTLTRQQGILAGVLAVVTFGTCLALGNQIATVTPVDFFARHDPLATSLPFALGIFGILAAREAAQRWVARQYDARLAVPFLLPSLQLGAFGTFSRMLSVLPSRKALFDIAIAAPIAGVVLSLVLLLLGLGLSAAGMGTMEVPSSLFQSSVLVGLLARLMLGDAIGHALVTIHPIVVLGWVGLAIVALNLMPAGQLDGGRIVQAVYGRRTAGWTTVATLVVLGLATVINPLALYWAGIILLVLRDLERPMLNELSELDGDRDALGLFALFWMLVTLLPLTPAMAAQLGIGG